MVKIELVPETRIRESAERTVIWLRERIGRVLPDVRIEHIGSSSIPGALTKGDVDVQVEVVPNAFEPARAALDDVFEHNPEMEPTPTFVSYSGTWQGVPFGVQLIRKDDADFNFVLWRDALISSPDLLARYNALKQEHTAAGVDAYRQAKCDFIERELQPAASRISGPSAPIEVVPYDPSWPAKFAAERATIEQALAPWIVAPIEHVGSTAVSGMAAKPVIDIMVPVESLDASCAAIPAAVRLEYQYWPYKADSMHWFCKPSDAYRTHHMRLIPYQGWLWCERLGFRDALRSDKRLAAEYAALKQALATRYPNDREKYTESKGAFVQSVLDSLGLPGGPAYSRRP